MYSKRIYTKQVLMLEITCFYVILHLTLKRFRFTNEPVTQRKHQSRANMIPSRTQKNSSWRHHTSCHIELYHDSHYNPNANPKMERDICEKSQTVMIGS